MQRHDGGGQVLKGGVGGDPLGRGGSRKQIAGLSRAALVEQKRLSGLHDGFGKRVGDTDSQPEDVIGVLTGRRDKIEHIPRLCEKAKRGTGGIGKATSLFDDALQQIAGRDARMKRLGQAANGGAETGRVSHDRFSSYSPFSHNS